MVAGGGRLDWEFGISRCKLLYIEWINNKILLYSTGNYIQYPVINHMEKNKKYHLDNIKNEIFMDRLNKIDAKQYAKNYKILVRKF